MKTLPSNIVGQTGRCSISTQDGLGRGHGKTFFLNYFEIMSTRAVGTILDSGGVACTVDKEDGPILVVVAGWDLLDVVDLETR